jgi:hypothetical protein
MRDSHPSGRGYLATRRRSRRDGVVVVCWPDYWPLVSQPASPTETHRASFVAAIPQRFVFFELELPTGTVRMMRPLLGSSWITESS